MTALMGTFVKVGTMADGTPRLTLDMQCTLAELAAMGLVPGVPFALARLEKEAAAAPAEKPKGGALARQAGIWCNDPKFIKWIGAKDSQDARERICKTCYVESRAELDNSDEAAKRFESIIAKPYRAYVNA